MTVSLDTRRLAEAVRLVVAKADDAPAPSIVICGLELPGRPSRAQVAGWMARARTEAMADDEKLGAKTIVLLHGPVGLKVEFFQGLAGGSYELSAETCVNSAACAAAAAVAWGAAQADVVVLTMAGAAYRFEVGA